MGAGLSMAMAIRPATILCLVVAAGVAFAQGAAPAPDEQPGSAAADAAAAPDDQLATLRKDRDELYDRLLRATAEFDNYRKRTERERRETSERATASVLEEILPVVVASDPEMKKTIYDESGRETEQHVAGLAPGRTYYWKVEAAGGKGSAANEGGVQHWGAAPATTFLGVDDTTLGQWKQRHGKAGYMLLAANPADWSDLKQLPPFIESVNVGGSEYLRWINTGQSNNPAAPEPASSGGRVSSALCDQWFLTVDIKARDEAEHTVSFYSWLGSLYPPDGMNEQVEVLDPESGRVIDQWLDRRMLDAPEGRYFSYRFKGRLLVRLRNESAPYCFLNGIFWEK
jgi:hypothetical protein